MGRRDNNKKNGNQESIIVEFLCIENDATSASSIKVIVT